MKKNIIKETTQDCLDFVLTNYGSLDYLFSFLQDAGYTSYMDFYSDSRSTIPLELPVNDITRLYRQRGIVISSINGDILVPNIVYNNDLESKTVILGSFDQSFDNSFDVQTETITRVGHEGMTVYIQFSFTNSGNKDDYAIGTVSFTDFSTVSFNRLIPAGETVQLSIPFVNVQAGVKQVVLTSSEFTQTIFITVLGNAIYNYNNDLQLVLSEDIDIGWSVTNSGTSAGIYTTNLEMSYNGVTTIIPFVASINIGQDYSFTYSVKNPTSGHYSFTVSGQTVSTDVAQLVPTIQYNNNLTILPINPVEKDIISVNFSITNTGNTGYTNGYIKYSSADQETVKPYGPILIHGGETIQIQKTFQVFGGSKIIILSGDISDTKSFTVTVPSNTTYKGFFWVENNSNTTVVYDQPVPTFLNNQTVYFKVNIKDNSGLPVTKRLSILSNIDFATTGVYDQNLTFTTDTTVVAPYVLDVSTGRFKIGENTADVYIEGVKISQIKYNIV